MVTPRGGARAGVNPALSVRARRFAPASVVLASFVACSFSSSPVEAAQAPKLAACAIPGARCGHIKRPIDPAGHVPGEIAIGFALFTHRNEAVRAVGTIVATEGGPGFPTTGSSAGYLGLFGPLLDDHDLLLVDNRGTGTSQPIDCRELQTMRVPTVEAVGACGRSLGAATDFYGSPLAADDIAAVLDALGIAKVDLYGDSYGTFTAQIFAGRHPERLRSLVLDGAFATRGESGFFPNTPAAIRRNLRLVCERAPDCRKRPGSTLDRLTRLVERLGAAPIHGSAPDADGKSVTVTLDAAAIGTILYDATYDPVNLAELDPAVRAMLDHDDAEPLLRLAAETATHADSRDPTGSAARFSYGLFAAVSCMDYPQLYDMAATPTVRRLQLEKALAAKRRDDPGIYAPLSIDAWRALPLDYSVLDLCLDWPIDTPPYPPGQPTSPTGSLAQVPTLVLSGELDTTTPIEDADLATAAFPKATHLVLANSFHVDAIDDQADCAAPIVRRFVASLDPGDTACVGRISPIHLAPEFVRHAKDATPALSDDGSKQLLAAAIVDTAADVLDRGWRNESGAGAGLRGGRFSLSRADGTLHFELRELRWAEDLAVSGTLDWDQNTGEVHGHLSGGTETLETHWSVRDPEARVSIEIHPAHGGKADTISAWMPVP